MAKVIVLTAPSGAGKTTLKNYLLENTTDLYYSISTTSRAPRFNERDGIDYRFISKKKFEKLINENAFIEYAEVFNNYYGTQWDQVQQAESHSKNLLLDLDIAGARAIKEAIPDAVLIFIMPPSVEELERRLKSRATDSEEVIQRRLSRAELEMEQASWFDHVIINDNLDAAKNQLKKIIDSID